MDSTSNAVDNTASEIDVVREEIEVLSEEREEVGSELFGISSIDLSDDIDIGDMIRDIEKSAFQELT